MLEALKEQFHQPSGWQGWLVGYVMQFMKQRRNTWVAELLALAPSDRVLEIGFGPGLAIEAVARSAAHVAGVDPSDVMLAQASQRNAAGIRAGGVDLRLGTAEQLPFADHRFNKAFAVNTFHHWADRQRGLAEVARVLQPGGMLIIVEQPVPGGAPVSIDTLVNTNADSLTAAGFTHVSMKVVEDGSSYLTAAIGFVPHLSK